MADPDLELKRTPGFVLLALPAFLLSVIFSYFTQHKGGPGGPGPSLRSATAGMQNVKSFKM